MISIVKIAVVLAISILCIIFYPYLTPQNISAFIEQYSVTAPFLFIAICAARPVLFFLPSMGLTVVAGVLFGAFWGTAYVVIGGVLSTAVGFYFAKWLGRDIVKRLLEKNKQLGEFERKSKENERNAVLYMRLLNLPWDLVSYWAGLSGIRFKDFYIASMIPLVPVSFLYTYFGSKIFTPTSMGFIVSLAIIFIMGSIPYIQSRIKKASG